MVDRGILVKDAEGLIDVELAKLALQNRVRPGSKTALALNGVPAPAPAPPSDSAVAAPGAAAPAPSAADAAVGAPAGTVTNFHVARTLREATGAQMDQLRLRKMQGELTEVELVKKGIFEISRMLRDMVLNVPKRVAAEAVASGDAREAERLMTEGLRRAFEDFVKLAKDEVERAALRSKASATE